MKTEFADYVLRSSAVFTADELVAHPGAVVVSGNEIVDVLLGERVPLLRSYLGPDTVQLDCGGKLIMPGFNDSHLHFALGSVQSDEDFCVDLMFAKSEEECVERVRTFAVEHPGDGWIYGCGWYSPDWEPAVDPSKESLDALEIDRPICLSDFSMHMVWANSKALELGGITRDTPQPEGGVIRHGEDGEPNGILCEPSATNILLDIVLNVPDLASSLKKSMRRFAALGITALGDMYPLGLTNEDVYGTYQELADAGNSTLRISFFPSLEDVPAALDERRKHHGELVRCGGVKYIMDGAVESYTAYLSEPYLNVPAGLAKRGECSCSQEKLDELVRRADAAGLAPRIHAIGDAAATMIVNAYEKAIRENGNKHSRFCIEHTDNIRLADLERMGRLGISAAIQPQHAIGGFPMGIYCRMLGDERERNMWRYREEVDNGVLVGLGTDWPAALSIDPIDTIYAAVTRSALDGTPREGYYRNNALSLGEALQAHTRGSAYLEGFEDRIGTLASGKLADLVVLNCNPFELDIMDLRSIEVKLTMFDGKVVYNKLN